MSAPISDVKTSTPDVTPDASVDSTPKPARVRNTQALQDWRDSCKEACGKSQVLRPTHEHYQKAKGLMEEKKAARKSSKDKPEEVKA